MIENIEKNQFFIYLREGMKPRNQDYNDFYIMEDNVMKCVDLDIDFTCINTKIERQIFEEVI